MRKQDARSLSSEAQQALRERAVQAVVELGVSRAEADRLFGVSEVNPVEYLNNDVKANAQRMSRAKNKDELHDQLNVFLEVTAEDPKFTKAYFQAKNVRYAA